MRQKSLKVMRRRFPPNIHHSGARLLRRVDLAAYRINPYLFAFAVGLIILDVIFFIGMKVSPPRPVGSIQLITSPQL
jgi:hypothetical protein